MSNILNDFKNGLVSKEALIKEYGNDLYNVDGIVPVVVSSNDVISILTAYITREIALERLIEWVNIVWFTDLFEYDSKNESSIASVLTVLEGLDEAEAAVTLEDIQKMICALNKNVEYAQCMRSAMQNVIELRCCSEPDERLCFTFQPVKIDPSVNWNPQWEEWHAYPTPLRVFITDYERLLKRHIARVFPTIDAFDGTPEPYFDEYFDSWLSADDYRKLIDDIEADLPLDPDERSFCSQFISWLKDALSQTSIIVIESNI